MGFVGSKLIQKSTRKACLILLLMLLLGLHVHLEYQNKCYHNEMRETLVLYHRSHLKNI